MNPDRIRRYTLPRPTDTGSYWIRRPDLAIFPIRGARLLGTLGEGFYMLSTPAGVIFDGDTIRAFESPQQAIDYLNRHGEGGA